MQRLAILVTVLSVGTACTSINAAQPDVATIPKEGVGDAAGTQPLGVKTVAAAIVAARAP